MKYEAIKNDFGVVVTDINVAGELDTTTANLLKDLFFTNSVMVLKNQDLGPRELCSFSSYFGALDIHHMSEHTFPEFPQIRVLSNVKKGGKLIGQFRGGHYWHTDLTYVADPGLITFLYGVECPPLGGDTLFADMRAVYDLLPEKLKQKIDGQYALHDRAFRYSELYPERPPLTEAQIAKVPAIEQPVVRVHPVTNRKAVYITKPMIRCIGNLSEKETAEIVDQLEEFAVRDEFVYRHQWEVGDLVLWDNLATLHCATQYDYDRYRRVMYRTQIRGKPEELVK